eukprot:GEZU01011776.1.p1 GENE.GEZU01011776.1~~GEZU01011776.1.p1  ORF type:complete len:223 (-),score=57.87 GEZU01011776.1:376-1014(-)
MMDSEDHKPGADSGYDDAVMVNIMDLDNNNALASTTPKKHKHKNHHHHHEHNHDHDHDHDDENEKKITATNAPAVAAEASSDDPKALRAEFVALFCGNCCRECGVVANRRSFLPGIIVCEPCRRARKDDKYKLINRSDAKAKYKFLTPEDFKESPSTRVISSFCSVDVFSERDLAMRNNRNMMLMMQQKNNSAAAAKTKPKTNKGHRRGSKK